jgi:NAD(P)-dependent dehydrogenase (short-subunit alcohol dehydrogenase family)
MNILITGTSSGIGFGLAMEYLLKGNNVYGISRRASEDLKPIEQYSHLQSDLTDFELVQKRVPDFIKDIEQLDIVILNSGILGEIRLMNEIDIRGMKKVMDINVWANKCLLDLLFGLNIRIKQVVGMSSKASLRSSPGWGPYSMSKAGLNMLMDIYAKEYPTTHFISFAPGLVDSEIQEQIYNIQETEKYPTTKVMQEARFTEIMPDPIKAAPRLVAGIEQALTYDSGAFADVRDM